MLLTACDPSGKGGLHARRILEHRAAGCRGFAGGPGVPPGSLPSKGFHSSYFLFNSIADTLFRKLFHFAYFCFFFAQILIFFSFACSVWMQGCSAAHIALHRKNQDLAAAMKISVEITVRI